MFRSILIAITIAACHSQAVRAPAAVATTIVSPSPTHAPGRADVDPSQLVGVQPLDEEIRTGHEPCDEPRSPIDDEPANRTRRLLISHDLRRCPRRVPGRPVGSGSPGL